MHEPDTDQMFDRANPQVLAWIAEASEHTRIVAARDIMDVQGIKLWARNQPVSRALQERLAGRDLAEPLESCLDAEDGVRGKDLKADMLEMADSSHPLALLVRHYAAGLAGTVERLPLHPAVRLLLTATRASRRNAYLHAVRGMALAGTLAISHEASSGDLKLALLGGLLHDLGEMYIEPSYLGGAGLDLDGLRNLAVHPRVGQLLLSRLTDYPPALARALGEHHERLDGSGYPMGTAQQSDLGRLLAVTETVLGVLDAAGPAPYDRAELALRLVPVEYDQRWTSFIAAAGALHGARSSILGNTMAVDEMRQRLRRIDAGLAAAKADADRLLEDAPSEAVREVAVYASQRMAWLRIAWNETGLWAHADDEMPSDARLDVELIERELRYRMRRAWHECLLRSADLSSIDKGAIECLGSGLTRPAVALAA